MITCCQDSCVGTAPCYWHDGISWWSERYNPPSQRRFEASTGVIGPGQAELARALAGLCGCASMLLEGLVAAPRDGVAASHAAVCGQ